MDTHEKSKYPPGYVGHEHGSRQKFGYSIPAPNPLPNAPIDGDAEDVNYAAGERTWTEMLPNRSIVLNGRPEQVVEPRGALYDGLENQQESIEAEDDKHKFFQSQTSNYLVSLRGRTPG